MKRRTKIQKFEDCFDAFKCIRENKKVKRSKAKDGSIPTRPIVTVNENLTEAEVLSQCRVWLNKHGITCWRHDSGTFQNQFGQWGTYGIKGSGDIHGLLPNGIHFEIECKAGKGGRLAANQQKHKKQVKDSNGLYFIVHGKSELEYYFKNLKGIYNE